MAEQNHAQVEKINNTYDTILDKENYLLILKKFPHSKTILKKVRKSTMFNVYFYIFKIL